ncbi:MAG: hypothetical protein HY363_02215 [Candidatus Aenigmarchaeota archaeon]|nr:hypothetical protein [Candidatus Aenigmarchaeota archaeon]
MKCKLVSFVVVDVGKHVETAGREVETKCTRSAPGYVEILPKYKVLESFQKTVAGKKAEFTVKFYEPDDVVVEASVEASNPFDSRILDLKKALADNCLEYAKKTENASDIYEEYSVYCIWDYKNLGSIVKKQKARLIGLMRSEIEEMDKKVVDTAFEQSSLKYSSDDLAVIGWDSAIVFSDKDEFPEITEILVASNIELLNSRLINNELEESLLKLSFLLRKKKIGYMRLREALNYVITMRTDALFKFDHIKKNINRYGDWYTAKLYALATEKFHTGEKMQEVYRKLDTFEDVYEMLYEQVNWYYLMILELGIFLLIVWEVAAAFF